MKYYTGIGSRKTPDDILNDMRDMGETLGCQELVLRSGAAPGADTAFEDGCDLHCGYKDIYLPWPNFQKNPSPLNQVSDEAMELAADVYGSRFKYLKMPVKLLMTRNVYQVLGMNLDTPSDFLVCWTPDGCESEHTRSSQTGGTGQAIALASRHFIPVFNLANEGRTEMLSEFLIKENYGN